MPYLEGLFDANHWSYIAAAMAEGIGDYKSRGKTDLPPKIPRAVLYAAKSFFDTVTEALDTSTPPARPLATACNYNIAANAIRRTRNKSLRRDELNQTLHDYWKLVHKLVVEGPLEESDLPLLSQLEEFFSDIAYAGEREAYEEYVAMGYHPRRH